MNRNVVAWGALAVSSLALVSSSGLVKVAPAARGIPADSIKVAKALSQAYESVAEFARPSVVQISVRRTAGATVRAPGRGTPSPNPFGPQNPGGNLTPKQFEDMLKRFFGPDFNAEPQQFSPGQTPRVEGTGSGFVFDDKGHIVTNNHVVEGADKIRVTFQDGVEAEAKVVGRDPQSDVAVIKVDVTTYPALPRGDSSKLKVGDLIMAVGSPFGLSQTVTTGIISATERNDVQINEFESFLQTDAAINPGNSGGPLVNMNGHVIGVNSAIVTGGRGNDGVGFAIPMNMAGMVADQLIAKGKVSRARIGVQMGVLTPSMARQFGLPPGTKGILINDVLPGSPADKAGLKSGDVILGFNDVSITSMPSFRMSVASAEAGKSYELSYLRDGKKRETQITPAPYEKIVFPQETAAKEGGEKPGEKAETPKELADFGLELQELTPALAGQFGLDKSLRGLLVTNVKDDGPAAAAGIKPGDVITQVVRDHKIGAITTLKDFESALQKTDEVAVFVKSLQSGGRFVTLSKKKD